MPAMSTGEYEHTPRVKPSLATVLSGVGLSAASIAGAADLVRHGRLPWPDGAFNDPDVLVPVIAVMMGFLAVFVLGEILRLAPRDVTTDD